MKRQAPLFIVVLVLLPSVVGARDLFVNHQIGTDVNSGLREDQPFKTIQHALGLVKPGDTIHLARTDVPYHESIEIRTGLSGTRAKPIIIDGHGATLSGCTTIRPEDWTRVGPGLYRNDRLLPDLFPREKPVNEPLLRRFFFVVNGRINRMGRSGKGDCPPLPKLAALQPGDWTYDEEEMAFYLRIDPARTLADERIEYPDLINGVKTSDGQCEHLIIRNLTATHFHNDGFNINGATLHTRFENIQAIECGDDGISAHAASDIEVDGFVSRGNSTGFCHVQGASSSSRNVVLEDNHGFELLVLGRGTHELKQSVIRPNHGQIRVVRVSSEGAEPGKGCTLLMEDVQVEADLAAAAMQQMKQPNPEHELTVEVLGKSDLHARKVTLSSVGLTSRWSSPSGPASVKLFDSVIGGKIKPAIDLLSATTWEADRNNYDLAGLNVSGGRYEQAQWDSYRRASGQDSHSVWQTLAQP